MLIKRFEFCYDFTWKFLRRYLIDKYSIEVNSPKKVFQELLKQKMISPDEEQLLLDMVEARNNTSHTYNEILAEEISHDIILCQAYENYN